MPCQVWGYNVLNHYGCPTLRGGDLYIVVPSPAEAAKVFQAHGYFQTVAGEESPSSGSSYHGCDVVGEAIL
ncbi:hypothetical protein VTN77DRAFT_7207 [Rasamsonia byssochlamydoides]|uniref:uncharacterized protein n=1 Tax=Rasamsonia byssochlamydoides TaxID=89139 RepID=UPI0037449B18